MRRHTQEITMHIQLSIDADGALRNLRYAFTDRFTLVSELLQNARRAQARHIVVEHDATQRRLTVHDDGQGINDFSDLLHVHASGWDAALQAQEHPFGVGFAKCLFSAERCVVHSGHLRADIDTAAALRQTPCEVWATDTVCDGTRVELYGVDLPDLADRMDRLCEGFPVEIRFNGLPLRRRYAIDRLVFESTPIGEVHLAGRHDGMATRGTLVFLQGFCVSAPNYLEFDRANIVHLDPASFMARLPDRDKLIDADQQLERVREQVRLCWRHLLEREQARMEPAAFVAQYYRAMRCWSHLALLNGMDALPTELFQRFVGYPVQSNDYALRYLEPVAVPPSREDIASGAVRVVALDPLHTGNAAHWMLARALHWLVVPTYGLDARHWLHHHIIAWDALDTEPAEVEALDLRAHTWFEGRRCQATLVLCRAVRIRVGAYEAQVMDAGVVHGGSILIPQCETSGEPVRQCCDFLDERDQHQDDDMEADRRTLAEQVRHLRSTDARATLEALLADLRLGTYPLLHGKTFEVTVGNGPAPGCSVEIAGADLATDDVPRAEHAER
jgi:hypothetical protein